MRQTCRDGIREGFFMEEVFLGKTVDEAVEAGLAALGITREEAEIEVLDEGKKKLIGGKPAQVRVKRKISDGARAVAFLEGLMPLLGDEDVKVSLKDEGERIVIELETDSARSVIGRRGEIIDAVQTLAGAVANTGRKEYKRVVVDCENYREAREETLRRVAKKTAAKAVRLGRRMRLEPMNPYERRIIHSALLDDPDVTTKSEGKEPGRYVVIVPNQMKPYEKKFQKNERGDRGGRNEHGGRGARDGRGFNRDRGRDFGRKPYPKRELPAEGTPESSGTSFRRDEPKKGSFGSFFGTFLGNESEEPEKED